MGYMETDGLGDTNRQLSDYANLEPIPNGRNEVWRAEYDGQAVCLKKFRILDAKQQKVLTFPLSTHQNVSLQNLSQYLVLVTSAGVHEGGAVRAEAAAPPSWPASPAAHPRPSSPAGAWAEAPGAQ